MLNQLSKFFSLPHRFVRTSGIQTGVILQFQRMYLKIYQEKEDKYQIEQYFYNISNPTAVHIVPTRELRNFAQRFSSYYSNDKNMEREINHPPNYVRY